MSITTRRNYIIHTVLDRILFFTISFPYILVHQFISALGSKKPKSEKVLLIKFTEQGAMALIAPILRKLKEQKGEDNIYVLTTDQSAGIYQALGICPAENIFKLNTQSFPSLFKSLFKVLKQLKRKNIDIVYDLHFFSFFSHTLSLYLGRQLSHFSSYNYKNKILNIVEYQKTSHMIDLYNALFNFESEDPLQNTAQKKLSSGLSRIALFPNPDDSLPLRKWPLHNWVQLSKEMNQIYPTAKITVIGEEKDSDIIKNSFPNFVETKTKFQNTKELINFLSEQTLLIASDSGPAHFATLSNTKTITLFGPESPKVFGSNLRNIESSVVYKDLPCSPCFNQYNGCLSLCKNNICMTTITTDDILLEVSKLIGENNDSKKKTENLST